MINKLAVNKITHMITFHLTTSSERSLALRHPLQYRPRYGCSLSKWGSQQSGMLVYLSLLLFYKNNVKRTCIAQLLFKSLCLACSKRHF